ncbi:MAG TPA: hypothetical protein VHM26_06800 [Chitinophagaceae bacterium]|nr:hypothetical protein [Chitinophagaceae bacterium]
MAKQVSIGEGDKIHTAQFYIITDLSDSGLTGHTIDVGYYFYKPITVVDDTVLLTINKYPTNDPKYKNYYTCPDYNGKLGVQKVRLNYISFEHWEACEMGKACPTITFTRKKDQRNWFLLMPCGGTQTSVTVSGIDNSFSKTINLVAKDCPPRLELTNMPDGKYTANMLACGLGGTVSFIIKTK